MGCLAKVLLPEPKKRKIGSKTTDCMLIGYVEHSVAYRFLVLKSNVLDCNTIIETKNVEFFEYIYPLFDKISHSSLNIFIHCLIKFLIHLLKQIMKVPLTRN